MRVGERMTRNPAVVRLGDSLATARMIMQSAGFKHLPVVERKRVLGVISDRDVRQHAGGLEDTVVEAAMTADPVTVSPDTRVEEAASLILVRGIGCLPVTEHGGLVGIITTSDLLRALLDIALVHAKQT
jgi:acetoin utilization protein AcuB